MQRHCGILLLALLLISGNSLLAETYSWKDKAGTVHYTDDPGQVPSQYRRQLRSLEDAEPTAEPAAEPGESGAQESADTKAPTEEKTTTPQPAAVTTQNDWQQQLTTKEAAMIAVRERLADIAKQTESPELGKSERKKLEAEYSSLFVKFKELKEDYQQFVDKARAAGVQVTIEQ